jgi:hypothetical protein
MPNENETGNLRRIKARPFRGNLKKARCLLGVSPLCYGELDTDELAGLKELHGGKRAETLRTDEASTISANIRH